MEPTRSNGVLATLIEKAAADNGFDLPVAPDGDWLGFASTHCPLQIRIGTSADGGIVIAFSQRGVAAGLAEFGRETDPPPVGAAVAARRVGGVPELHALLRRAFQLSRALPDAPLREFEERTAALPRTTEAERLVIQRVGQDIFRDRLLDYWEGRCAITGLAVPELLRASHIKRWADCTTDAERLDVYNGLLLAPHLDAAFDAGFITIAEDGGVVVSGDLGTEACILLGISCRLTLGKIEDGHRPYFAWHRKSLFRGAVPKV